MKQNLNKLKWVHPDSASAADVVQDDDGEEDRSSSHVNTIMFTATLTILLSVKFL